VRPDPDDCRDPDLLAAEVRRLRAVVDSGTPVVARTEPRELSDADLVANLLALADWQKSDDLAAILRTAASRLNALAKQRLTDEEREAIEWAAYAAEKWYEHTAADTLRGLLERAAP
jgi:PHP family Zn ribbon phosphoesterase